MAQNEGAVLPASAGHMSAAGRLANVILEPKAAFTDIAARPGFWVPLVLLVGKVGWAAIRG